MTPVSPRAGRTARLAIVGPSGRQIARLRGNLIRECARRGIAVLAVAPALDAAGTASLLALGAETRVLPEKSGRMTPFKKTRATHALSRDLMNWGASAVLAFGNDLAPSAILAARLARVQRAILLVSEIREGRLNKRLAAAVRMADATVTHNERDARLVRSAAGRMRTNVLRLSGAGADLAEMATVPPPPSDGPVVFLAAARLDKIKGIHTYLEAARKARERGLDARFVLAGPAGSEKRAIAAEELSGYSQVVQYAGDRDDLGPLLRNAHVFVCPSRAEGMPHGALQAMAAGRALIVTDIPGARDTVDENVNGTIVPVRDPDALASAFERLAGNRGLLAAMGRAARAKAERGFSAADVNRALLDALHLS